MRPSGAHSFIRAPVRRPPAGRRPHLGEPRGVSAGSPSRRWVSTTVRATTPLTRCASPSAWSSATARLTNAPPIAMSTTIATPASAKWTSARRGVSGSPRRPGPALRGARDGGAGDGGRHGSSRSPPAAGWRTGSVCARITVRPKPHRGVFDPRNRGVRGPSAGAVPEVQAEVERRAPNA